MLLQAKKIFFVATILTYDTISLSPSNRTSETEVQLSSKPSNPDGITNKELFHRVIEVERQNQKLTEELKALQERELWFHTQLKLRYTMRKMENMIRPTKISMEDWSHFTRTNKWKSFFEGNEDFGLFNFITCVREVSSNSEKLVTSMNRIYDILSARIHNYLEIKEISPNTFQEEVLRRIALCLDGVDV